MYISLEAADAADVMRQALITLCKIELRQNQESIPTLLTEGNDLIPARSIAITKGEAAAVPFVEARFKPGELDGTRRPMTVVPRT